MARRASARRYAQAVFEIALETKELDRWQSDLGKIVRLMEDGELKALLESPQLPIEAKVRLLSERLENLNPLALNLVLLLIAKGRLGIIGDIVDEYQRLLDGYHGIERAEVVTAVSLDEEDRQKLAKELSAVFGKKVVLETKVNPEVIGGVVVRVDWKLLDGSVRSKLAALKRELAGAGD